MKKVKLNLDTNPIGTKHYMAADGGEVPYHVVAVWGSSTFAPSIEPLIIAEAREKGRVFENPFLTLPLSVFAEVFQYSDQAFWVPVKQHQPSEGHAESVPEQ